MENEEKKEIRYIDLFGGVGGFRLGIERAINVRFIQQEGTKDKPSSDRTPPQYNQGIRTKCVFYNDFDKYAVQTYNKNFKENWEATDIRTIKTSEIPDFDFLCAGFPCQAFSIAGKRKGFEDTRGTLFYEIARILKAKKPEYFLLENVKGLLSHDRGRTFAVILSTLTELGYDVQWMVLNSKFFGVPQNRERVFIIGSLRGTSRPEILPFGESSQDSPEKSSEEDSESNSTLTATYHKGGKGIHIKSLYKPKFSEGDGFEMNKRVYGIDGLSPTLQGSDTEIKIVHSLYPRSSKTNKGGTGHLTKEPIESYALDTGNQQGLEFEGMKIRRLTPIECERLQGFPDNWTKGVSDTQRYKQMGNAVTVNVIQAIIEKMFK